VVLVVSEKYASIFGWLWKKCGLFSGLIHCVEMGETNVTGDPDKCNLGVNRVESLYGEMNSLEERVSSVEVRKRMK